MKLLVFTQKVDKDDAILGFFHTWLKEFSKHTTEIIVICLYKGEFDLPKNVTVYSLGKEKGVSKLGLLLNLYRYLLLIAGSYDRVFVHMNEEYVLLAGFYWKIKNTPVYLWRNHPHGSIKTRIAVALSKKVFCTSKMSFTARFNKTVIMPVGIDTNKFKPVEGVVRKKYSACMIGRVSPIKGIHIALQSLKILMSRGVQISFHVIGPVNKRDSGYYESLKKYANHNGLSHVVSFYPAVAPNQMAETYSGYEVCLNLTESGSFDKTIVESSACGAIPLVSNYSLKDLLPEVCITEKSAEKIALSLQRLLDPREQLEIQGNLKNFVNSNSLSSLVYKLFEEIK